MAESIVADIFSNTTTHGVIIADGYGVTVNVRSGHLHISDGIGRYRRERRIPRLPRTTDRLVILASTGMIATEAIRWLADAAIPWVHLDHEGNTIAESGATPADARLLRAQAYAAFEPSGLEITKYLLGVKLCGQADICRNTLHVPNAVRDIESFAVELSHAPELDDCRTIEGSAAVVYWGAWQNRVSVPFSPADMLRVPASWAVGFSGRESAIGPAHRHATTPINALISYAHKIIETSAVHACYAYGLAPQLGILHSDKQNRDSMALDLAEVANPVAERLILDMLDTGLGVPRNPNGNPAYIPRQSFSEERDGQCRLVPPLTHTVASWSGDITAAIMPHAERVAKILAGSATGHVAIPRDRQRKNARTTAPKTSTRQTRLREGVTVKDIIPDSLWETITGFLPEPPASPVGRRKTGRPRDVSKDREILAAIVAHELLGVPYGYMPVAVSAATCRGRLTEYQWTKLNGATAYEHIVSEVQGFGHLAALSE